MTKCPKCEQSGFELIEETPIGTTDSFLYLRCTRCKTFLQALYRANTNVMVDNLQNDINKIKAHLGIIEIKSLI